VIARTRRIIDYSQWVILGACLAWAADAAWGRDLGARPRLLLLTCGVALAALQVIGGLLSRPSGGKSELWTRVLGLALFLIFLVEEAISGG